MALNADFVSSEDIIKFEIKEESSSSDYQASDGTKNSQSTVLNYVKIENTFCDKTESGHNSFFQVKTEKAEFVDDNIQSNGFCNHEAFTPSQNPSDTVSELSKQPPVFNQPEYAPYQAMLKLHEIALEATKSKDQKVHKTQPVSPHVLVFLFKLFYNYPFLSQMSIYGFNFLLGGRCSPESSIFDRLSESRSILRSASSLSDDCVKPM